MSNQEDIIYPQGALFLTVRGWRPRQQRENAQDREDIEGQERPSDTRRGSQDLSATLQDVSISMAGQSRTQRAAEKASSEPLTSPDIPSGRRSESRSEPDTEPAFQFVNTTQPGSLRDPSLRRLVKSHVKKRSDRNKNLRSRLKSRDSGEGSAGPSSRAETSRTRSPDSIAPPSVSGSTTPTYGHGNAPFPMTPKHQSLLDYCALTCGLSVQALRKLLIRSGWFPLALKDEMLFRCVLFCSATHLAREAGRTEFEPDALIQPIFQHLNKKLQTQEPLSDTTIGIVSCLAMVEVARGNYDRWNMHMNAMKVMIRQRGGVRNLEGPLQIKIARADVEGAVNCVALPHLMPFERSVEPTYSILPSNEPLSLPGTMQSSLAEGNICTKLRDIFIHLLSLSRAIEYAFHNKDISLNPQALDEDFVEVQHRLLLWVNTKHSDLDEACRLGGLVYSKCITRSVKSISARLRPVVQQLMAKITDIVPQPGTVPLLIWLCYVGAISVCIYSSQRAWFVHYIAGLTGLNSRFSTWEGMKYFLSDMLWVEKVHVEPFKKVWTEVEAVTLASTGSSRSSSLNLILERP